MKKLLALILAVCLVAGLLPMTTMAEAPNEVSLQFYVTKGTKIPITLKDGDIVYMTANAEKLASKWDEAEAPTDNYVKLEYTAASATVKATMQNFNADMSNDAGWSCHGIEFFAGAYAVEMELVGKNSLQQDFSSCIKFHNEGGMTITGAGSLDIIITNSSAGAIWSTGGDLLIKDTTINFNIFPGSGAKHHAILSTKNYDQETLDRKVIIENTKIDCQTGGGQLVFIGDCQKTGDKNGRYTMDTASNCQIIIKDCNIVSKSMSAILRSKNPATISNTSWKATITVEGPLFSGVDKAKNPPTIEGEYTAIAGLAKNAEKLDKLKEYSPKKLDSYTYFYMVPGKVDLLPTEAPTTEATEAPTIEAPTTEATEAPTTEATEAPTTEATEAPTTADKDVTTKPTTADKDDNKTDKTDKTDKTEEKSGSPLKVILIVLIILLVAAGAAVGVIFYLRNKNAALEEGEDEEAEEAEEETEEAEEAEEETEE